MLRDSPGWAATENALRSHAERVARTAYDRRGSVELSSIKKYFVLSTPRSGSTLFCETLALNGLGWPLEWFNELYIKHLSSQLDLPIASGQMRDYIETVVLGTYNPQFNVFGVSIHVGQYLRLKQLGTDLLDIGFDRGYYLERRNKANQAYSLAKAGLTGFWSRKTELEAGHDDPPEANVSASEFCRRLAAIVSDCTFAEKELRPHFKRTFVFEELIAGGISGALAAVFADLNLSSADLNADIRTQRQSTDLDRVRLREILQELRLQQATTDLE